MQYLEYAIFRLSAIKDLADENDLNNIVEKLTEQRGKPL